MARTTHAPESAPKSLSFTIPVNEYRSMPIPGFEDSKLGTCYVRATDIPAELDDFMRVNPRVPNRTDSGRLSGPVPKAILETLREWHCRQIWRCASFPFEEEPHLVCLSKNRIQLS